VGRFQEVPPKIAAPRRIAEAPPPPSPLRHHWSFAAVPLSERCVSEQTHHEPPRRQTCTQRPAIYSVGHPPVNTIVASARGASRGPFNPARVGSAAVGDRRKSATGPLVGWRRGRRAHDEFAEVVWVLLGIRDRLHTLCEAFIEWNGFGTPRRGLFVWEAIASGAGKQVGTGDAHASKGYCRGRSDGS